VTVLPVGLPLAGIPLAGIPLADIQQTVLDGSLLVALPVAVAAGAVSFLSPCVLPLVPAYLGYLGGRAVNQVAEEPAA
jgi:cytochrome c-type biogenesis protein